MTNRSALLATAAVVTVSTAWTVTASTAFLWFTNGTWQVWEPGPFWTSAYFSHGLRWTWAWVSYAASTSTWATYGQPLAYTGLGAAGVVGVFAFRISQILGLSAASLRPSVYGKTEWADRRQAKEANILTSKKPF